MKAKIIVPPPPPSSKYIGLYGAYFELILDKKTLQGSVLKNDNLPNIIVSFDHGEPKLVNEGFLTICRIEYHPEWLGVHNIYLIEEELKKGVEFSVDELENKEFRDFFLDVDKKTDTNTNSSIYIENSIKDEIAYCEKKAIEYKKDATNNIGGVSDYWKGKADAHQYIATRLKRVLKFYEKED